MLNQDFFMDYVYEIHIEIYSINEHNVKTGYNVWSVYLENFKEEQIPEILKTMIDKIIYLKCKLIELFNEAKENGKDVFIEYD